MSIPAFASFRIISSSSVFGPMVQIIFVLFIKFASLSYMRMRKQMILTVFIIAIALGTETEFQMFSVLLRSSADRTFMFGDSIVVYLASMNGSLKFFPSVNLFRIVPAHISCHEKEYNKVHQRTDNRNSYRPSGLNHLCQNHQRIGNAKPFDF